MNSSLKFSYCKQSLASSTPKPTPLQPQAHPLQLQPQKQSQIKISQQSQNDQFTFKLMPTQTNELNHSQSNTNINNTTKGTLRSVIKFDYDMKLSQTQNMGIRGRNGDEKIAANMFSFLDSTSYKREFQVTPKHMIL